MLDILRTGAWTQNLQGFHVAWHLRQTNTKEAADVARALLATDVIRSAATPPLRMIKGYLHLVVSESYLLIGQCHEAQEVLSQAAAEFLAADCQQGLSDALWLESSLASDLGQPDRRSTLMNCSLSAADRASDPERSASSRIALACFSLFDESESSGPQQAEFVNASLENSSSGVRALAHCFLSHIHLGKGKLVDGLEHATLASAAAQDCGQLRRAIIDGMNACYVLSDLNDFEACVDHAQELVAMARRCAWPPVIGISMTALAQALHKMGRNAAASTIAEEAADLLSAVRSSRGYLLAAHTAADCALAAGDNTTAKLRYRELVDSILGNEGNELRRYGLLGLARVEAQTGSLLDAQDLCTQALELSRQASDLINQVDALRLLSQLALRSERHGPDLLSNEQLSVVLLRDAVGLTNTIGEYPASAALMDDFSKALESCGCHEEALQVLRKAMVLLASDGVRDASRKAVALEVRFKTERALADAELQRKAAEFETLRANELETLNAQLKQAMCALQSTQALLIQRNDELTAAYSRISDLSLTDPLTGLRNRRFLTQVIDLALSQCLRSYRPSVFGELDPLVDKSRHDIVFFLLDIDHFKLINDQHGHAAGDAVLVQLKDRLRTVTREHDYLVRWGGEEFLVAVRDIDRREAPVMAERLRLCVESMPFPIGSGVELKKTVSIGFASFPLDPANPTAAGWESVVEIADSRLYAAKRAGRNCWVGDDHTHHPLERVPALPAPVRHLPQRSN